MHGVVEQQDLCMGGDACQAASTHGAVTEQGLHTHEVEGQSLSAGAASPGLGLTKSQGLTSLSKLSAWSSARGKPSICPAAVNLVRLHAPWMQAGWADMHTAKAQA